MQTTSIPQDVEIVFRPSLHRFLWLLATALGVGAAGLFQALAADAPWGWVLALVALVMGSILAARFAGHAIILGADELIIRTGAFRIHETSVPVWQVRLEVRRSLLGVWGDYGTVLVHADEMTAVVPHLGQLRAFRQLLAVRRRLLLEQYAAWRGVPLPYVVHAPERPVLNDREVVSMEKMRTIQCQRMM